MMDFQITVGVMIQIVIIIVGFIASWFTLKTRSEHNTLRITSLHTEIEAIKVKQTEMQLSMANDYVPKALLEQVEDRIIARVMESNKMIVDNMKDLADEIREMRSIIMRGK